MFVKSHKEHDEALQIIKTLRSSGLTVNRGKCEFKRPEDFLVLCPPKTEFSPDPKKIHV